MAVRYSIFIVGSIATSVGALVLWLGRKPYTQALQTLENWKPKAR